MILGQHSHIPPLKRITAVRQVAQESGCRLSWDAQQLPCLIQECTASSTDKHERTFMASSRAAALASSAALAAAAASAGRACAAAATAPAAAAPAAGSGCTAAASSPGAARIRTLLRTLSALAGRTAAAGAAAAAAACSLACKGKAALRPGRLLKCCWHASAHQSTLACSGIRALLDHCTG